MASCFKFPIWGGGGQPHFVSGDHAQGPTWTLRGIGRMPTYRAYCSPCAAIP